MCGITGWIDFTRDLTREREILRRMNKTLQSRGPDGEGFWFSEHAALGHRRLIVIDPEGGNQPMVKKWMGMNLSLIITAKSTTWRNSASNSGHWGIPLRPGPMWN